MKKAIFTFVICTMLIANVFAIPNEAVVIKGLNTFIEDLAKTAPDSAVGTGTWSDAYIGKLIPSIPPHFGLGATVGVTKLNCAGLNTAIAEFTGEPLLPETFILPSFAVEARIGGLFLPFDISGKYMKFTGFDLPAASILNSAVKSIYIDYETYGATLRIAVLQENIILPNISIGAGYNHVAGGINAQFKINVPSIPGFVVPPEMTEPILATSFKSDVLDINAQISKSFFIVTPFVGVRAMWSTTETSWAYADRSNSLKKENDFSAQVFGGASLNIFLVKLNVSAAYNFMSDIISGTVGLRVQL